MGSAVTPVCSSADFEVAFDLHALAIGSSTFEGVSPTRVSTMHALARCFHVRFLKVQLFSKQSVLRSLPIDWMCIRISCTGNDLT